MRHFRIFTVPAIVAAVSVLHAQDATVTERKVFGPYLYETQPDHEAFKAFRPRKAPSPGDLLLREGDRLAICGDSITEQKMYSRIIETYLTVCVPQLKITARQYGWSGEKTDGFLRRMEQDCLTFKPTIATLAYGMNDSRYRPFDVNNGRWYEDHYSAIVQRFKQENVRVVVGSPGCAGKIASWVKSRVGTLADHNLHLCALRDIALGVAEREEVRFADIFWPMLKAQVFAPTQHNATDGHPYYVAGQDGIHPGWAGQVIMAWAILRSMGLDGEIGTICVDLNDNRATATDGHSVDSIQSGKITLTSSRYPFCARGDLHDHNSIRSGMTLVPFADELNRFILKADVSGNEAWNVTWGQESHQYSAAQLRKGVNLAADFENNPFCEAFDRVDSAVAKKQAYETEQVKRVFHSREGKENFAAAVKKTEAVRKPLAAAIAAAMRPVTHSIEIQSAAKTADAQPKLLESRRIWDEAPHNAFTDLLRHGGRWYCVFREGSRHVSPDGSLRVISSVDGNIWESLALVTHPTDDLRDAKLSVTPDGEFMLNGAGMQAEKDIRYHSMSWFSSDNGRTWDKGRRIGDPGFWLWRAHWHKDVVYSMGYETNRDRNTRRMRFYRSDDGKTFRPLIKDVNVPNGVGEDRILFRKDGSALCLLRHETGSKLALLGKAKPPFTDWTWMETNLRIGGPNMIELPDGRILAATRLYSPRTRTSLSWVDTDAGTLTECLELPSGGDTSYAGMVLHDGILWISYYSSHEDKTAIYLAKVQP